MSGDHSDGEGSVGHEAEFVDTTGDREVELRLPLEVDMDPDRPCKTPNPLGGHCPERD